MEIQRVNGITDGNCDYRHKTMINNMSNMYNV